MITATVIFYNDGPELLERCMVNLKACGFPIIAVDGAFREWMQIAETDIPYSTDGCIDVAKHFADDYISAPDCGWHDEMEKRNMAMAPVEIGDYFMIADADEVIDEQLIDKDLSEDVYRMMEELHNTIDAPPRLISRNRVFKKYDDLCFLYQHCRLYRLKDHKDGDLASGLVSRSATGNNNKLLFLKSMSGSPVHFKHYPFERPIHRQELKHKYALVRGENRYPF